MPTRPAGELLRNSIAIRKAGDELDGLPGNVEADTVAHCGPSARGEFCRTLTVVDIATGWTENASCRNNAFVNFSKAEETIEGGCRSASAPTTRTTAANSSTGT